MQTKFGVEIEGAEHQGVYCSYTPTIEYACRNGVEYQAIDVCRMLRTRYTSSILLCTRLIHRNHLLMRTQDQEILNNTTLSEMTENKQKAPMKQSRKNKQSKPSLKMILINQT